MLHNAHLIWFSKYLEKAERLQHMFIWKKVWTNQMLLEDLISFDIWTVKFCCSFKG